MNAIEVRDLAVSYGQVDALHGVSFDVPGHAGVADRRQRRRQDHPAQGADGRPARAPARCCWGQPLGNTPVEERVRRSMCLVPEKRSLFASMKVEDSLRLGAYAFRRRTDFARELERLRAVPGIGAAARAAGRHAVRRRAADGRHRPRLIAHPRVLLLDEPSIGLAPLIVQQIMDVVVDLRRREGPDRDPGRAETRASRSRAPTWPYLIELGRIVKQGSGAELAQDPDLLASYLGACAA